MSEQHTPEPWSYQASIPEDGFECFFINGKSKRISDFDGPQDEEQFSNVRRIVAAVNACAGFSIEELEGASLFNDSISAQDEIDSLKSEVEEMKLIIATDTGTESAVAAMQKQRDELLAALKKMQKCKSIYNMFPSSGRKSYGSIVDDALASVKASE